MSDAYILGIESSCDETAAAVVRSGEQIVSNVVFSQIATHQPYGGVGGTSEDIALQAKEILELKKITASLMARFTGQPLEKIHEDSERDFYMDAYEARDYGIIDKVYVRADEEDSQGPSGGRRFRMDLRKEVELRKDDDDNEGVN